MDAARAARTHDARSAILIETVQRESPPWTTSRSGFTACDLATLQRCTPRLAEAASGAWSVPESELLDLVATSAVLPVAWANPVLTPSCGAALTTPDVWFDDVAMAVMVHSHRFHSQGDQWDDTVDKDGDLVAAGIVVAGVTPHRIRERPDAVLARLDRAYLAAKARPRPDVRATPRHLLALQPSRPAS